MKKNIYIILFLCCCLYLGGCQTSSLDTKQLDSDKYSAVVMGTTVRNTYSVENSGIFYIGRNGTLLMYYDYETDENYALCSSPNCKHDEETCPAYVGNNYRNYTYAYYGGTIYYLRKETYESEKIELIAMDPGGQNQKTITSLEAGDYSVNNWTIDSISPVYFSKNKAFLELDYKKILMKDDEKGILNEIQGRQLMMISLIDGETTALTDILEYGKDYDRLNFSSVFENYAVYEIMKYDETLISSWEYIQLYGEEAYNRDYDAYIGDYISQTNAKGEYYAIDIEEGSVSKIWSGNMNNYEGVMMGPGFVFEYEGLLYYRFYDEAKELTLYSLDPKTASNMDPVSFTEEVNDLWYIEQNSKGGKVYQEDEILVSKHDSDDLENFMLYKYSFKDGTLTEVWDEYVYYDIWGMTDNYVILSNTSSEKISWITKEDYEQKNFAAAKRIKLDW